MTVLREALIRLDAFVKQQMQSSGTPGLVLAATDRESLLHLATYGYADFAAQKPVVEETLFEIGSISKSFTAIALLQMVEAGQLDLHAPVARFLPWFRVPSVYSPITPHHLLSHSAGIIRGTDFSTDACYEVWALRESEASSPPGIYYHYSNVGYKALGLVLEQVSGEDYATAIQKRILDPLGMTATEPVITHDTRRRLAVGYERLYDDRPSYHGDPLVPATWLETATADGSIATTVTDLAVYLRMLINRGQGPGERIIAPESFDLMVASAIELPEDDEDFGASYGYGLNIADHDGHMIIGHGGGMVGYYGFVLADVDDGLGVVVLVNGPGAPGEIARGALEVLRAGYRHRPLPAMPDAPEPAKVELAVEYAGIYRSSSAEFRLEARNGRLVMLTGGADISLEPRGTDRFYVPHAGWRLYLLHFAREEGHVVEAFHGPDWYTGEGYTGPRDFAMPAAWAAYPGHYRSHNPWYSNFRIVQRKGKLVLIHPSGEEEALVPVGAGVFRVGADEQSPERLRFDTAVDGRALRANLSGCDYYRTFTP